MKVKSENYLTIQGWMRTELNLSGNELLVYAIIYSFNQGENTGFNGSLQYLADWCGATKQGILKNLKGLQSKGLIIKKESENPCEPATYYSTKVNTPVTKGEYPSNQRLTEIKKTINHRLPDNKKNIDNYNNTKDDSTAKKPLLPENKNTVIDDIYNLYLDICDNLPRPRILTDKRKNLILKAYKQYGLESIKEVFKKANASDFLCGKNDRGWKADIDWLLGDKFINVLEGKYDTHKSTNSKAWERGVISNNKLSEKDRQAIEDEADRLESIGVRARF